MKKYAFLLFVGYISFSSSMEGDQSHSHRPQNLSSSMVQRYDPKTNSIKFDSENLSGADLNDRQMLSRVPSSKVSDLKALQIDYEYQKFFDDTEQESYDVIDNLYTDDKPKADLFKKLFHKLTKMEATSIRAINTEINTQLNNLSSRIDAILGIYQRNEQRNIDLEKNEKKKTINCPFYKSFLVGSILTNIVLTSTLFIKYFANEG